MIKEAAPFPIWRPRISMRSSCHPLCFLANVRSRSEIGDRSFPPLMLVSVQVPPQCALKARALFQFWQEVFCRTIFPERTEEPCVFQAPVRAIAAQPCMTLPCIHRPARPNALSRLTPGLRFLLYRCIGPGTHPRELWRTIQDGSPTQAALYRPTWHVSLRRCATRKATEHRPRQRTLYEDHQSYGLMLSMIESLLGCSRRNSCSASCTRTGSAVIEPS